MGFFSDVTDTLFGDQGAGAAEDQAGINAADRERIAQLGAQARTDVLPLFDSSFVNRGLGAQAALDVFGGSIPAQLGAFQQGNVGAQQALLGGDFTPQTINVDTSFIPAQIPQLQNREQAVIQGREAETRAQQALGAQFNTNLELFQAAGRGDIRGVSPEDQKFFASLSRDVARQNPTGSQLVDNPLDRSFIGLAGGLDTKNELRLANLLGRIS